MGAADDVIAAVEERGLRIVVDGDGQPRLVGDRSKVTQKMLKILRELKPAIVARIGIPPPPTPERPPMAKPEYIEWRLSTGIILNSFPVRPPGAVDMRPRMQRLWIPYGASKWRLGPADEWREMDELPPEWGLKLLSGSEPRGDDDEELHDA